MKQSCGDCRFFDGMLLDEDGHGRGNCLRYAPRPYVDKEEDWPVDDDVTKWPRVGVKAWCGEYEAMP
jgi:hypothetical protein